MGLLSIAICSIIIHHKQSNKAPTKPYNTCTDVTVFQVQSQDLPVERTYAGRAHGSKDIDITSRVDGIIIERLYREGQFVKKGEILFKLDPAPLQAALAKAQANLDIMQKDFDRSRTLFDKKFVSMKGYQTSLAQYQEALSDVKVAQINLDYATIRAPIDGYTSQEFLTVGSLAHAGTTILTHMVQVDPIYIDFALSENEVIKNRSDILSGKLTMPADGTLQARIQLDNGQILPEIGQVNFTDVLINLKTATVNTRVTVNNLAGSLIPGQFVRLFIDGLIYKNITVIPDQAVQQDIQSPYVYVVDAKHHVKIRRIVLGDLEGNLRIISKGLHDHDLVIMEGMLKIKPDQLVCFNDKSIFFVNEQGILATNTMHK